MSIDEVESGEVESGEVVPGTVWAATWIPSPPPIAGSDAAGFSVAWVDTADGRRLQVVVGGDEAPPIGTTGLVAHDDDLGVPVFEPARSR